MARQARARWAARPLDASAHRVGLGDGARIGAARAPRRARSRPARNGARVRQRPGAGQARVLHAAASGDRQHAPDLAAPVRSAALGRRRLEGAAQRLARRRLHGTEHRRGAGRARQADARRSDHDARRPRGEPVRGGVLCAGLRAGRHAGARAGDRASAARAARPKPDRRGVAQRDGPRRSGIHRRVAAAGDGAARIDRRANTRASVAGRAAAPDAAGRADERAARPARGRAR